MKKALLLALSLTAVPPVVVEAQQDLDELVQQGDTYLKRGLIKRNNLRPYTGDVIRFPSLFVGSIAFSDGKKVACGGGYSFYVHSRDGTSVCAGGEYSSYVHSRSRVPD